MVGIHLHVAEEMKRFREETDELQEYMLRLVDREQIEYLFSETKRRYEPIADNYREADTFTGGGHPEIAEEYVGHFLDLISITYRGRRGNT